MNIEKPAHYSISNLLYDSYLLYLEKHPDEELDYDILADRVQNYFSKKRKIPKLLTEDQFFRKHKEFMENPWINGVEEYARYLDQNNDDTIYDKEMVLSDTECEDFLHNIITITEDYWGDPIIPPYINRINELAFAFTKILEMDEDMAAMYFDMFGKLDSDFYRKYYITQTIKEYMTRTNDSAVSLSRKTNLGHSTISKLINGTDTCTIKQFRELASALNIPDNISSKCEEFVHYLQNPEGFWLGYQYAKTIQKQITQLEEK